MSIRRAHAPRMLRGLATSAAALATMLALSAPAGAAGVTTLESVASDGTQANGWSLDPSISGDGRSVVFTSIADKLVPGDTNNFSDTFVHTRGGTTERESVDSTESRGGSSARASISDDGRFVAYVGFNGTSEDVIVRDRQTGTVERADVASDGTGGNADGFNVKISGDGRYVAFASFATNLVADDPSGQQLFVHDRVTGSTELVPGSSTAAEPQAISDDGRFVAYSPGWPFQKQVYVYDRSTGDTQLVSKNADGAEGDWPSRALDFSGDGGLLLMRTNATNLVAGATTTRSKLVVRDMTDGSYDRVDLSSSGAPSAEDSSVPSGQMSDDGRYVVFDTFVGNLVDGDTNNMSDVFVRDRVAHTTERVSVAADGTQANDQSELPTISDDGRYVAFESMASNLDPDDRPQCAVDVDGTGVLQTLNCTDVFVHDRLTGTVQAGATFTSAAAPTADAPVAASVTTPVAGAVSVHEVAPGAAPAGYTFVGKQLQIEAPKVDPATGTPLKLSFAIDASLFAPGDAAALAGIAMFRDGAEIPACTGGTLDSTNPDAVCVLSRDVSGGVGTITVLSWHASTWNVAKVNKYDWTGFLVPVANPPKVNTVKAGSLVPVSFRLGGDRGLDVLAKGSPSSRPVSCTTGAALGAAQPTTVVGPRLAYVKLLKAYTHVWRTAATYTGCRELTVALRDGTEHRATFRFTR